MRVELLSFRGCPHVSAARRALEEAFRRAAFEPSWREVDLESEPEHSKLRSFGSPTVLVNGREVTGRTAGGAALSCHLYGTPDGAPPVDAVESALRRAAAARTRRTALANSAVAVPGLLSGLLPVASCPACVPAYLSVLSSVGLGAVMERGVLLPLTGLFLGASVGSLAWGAKRRRGMGPAALAFVGGASHLLARFTLDWSVLAYAGLAMVLAAAVWHAWPMPRAGRSGTCCDPRDRKRPLDPGPWSTP